MTESSEKLGRRIARGGIWTTARHGVHQAFSLLQVMVVARLLPPSEVGLLSMATLVITIATTLTETGFGQALIQRRDVDDDMLHVAWSVMVLRGALLALAMAGCAGMFAAFFAEPRVAELLRVLAITMLIEGLISIRVVVFQKRLDFKRQFIFQMAGEAVGLGTTIAFAWATHSVWAMVWGQLASATARLLSSYALEPHWPRFRMRWQSALELMRYGRWVTASTALALALGYGDNMFVGKVLGAEALAFYSWAFQLSNVPGILISQVLSSVMFPAYAAVNTDRVRLSALFERSLRLTLAVAIPAAALIAALSNLFTRAVLGARWLPIVPIVFALSGFGAMRALAATAVALLQAVGKPYVRTAVQIAQVVVLALAIVPLSMRYGVIGVGWAVALYGLLNIYAVVLCLKICELPLSALTLPAFHVGIATAGGVALALLVAHGAEHLMLLLALVLASIAGVVGFLAVLFGIDRIARAGYLDEARSMLRMLRNRAPT